MQTGELEVLRKRSRRDHQGLTLPVMVQKESNEEGGKENSGGIIGKERNVLKTLSVQLPSDCNRNPSQGPVPALGQAPRPSSFYYCIDGLLPHNRFSLL